MFLFFITKVQMLYHLYARVVTYAQNYHKVRGVESGRDTQPRSCALGTHSLVHRVSTPYHGCAQHTHMKNSQSLASLNPLHNKVQFFPEHDTLV